MSVLFRVDQWLMLHRFFLFSLCLFVANQAVAAPRIVCDSPKYDFGTVIGQEKITHEFVLWNRGDSPVKIAKIKNCCGVTSSITPMEIPPGSNAVCKAVFNTRNRYGKQDKQILIATNDRRKPYFELKMNGTLLRPVEFSPRLVRLNNLFPNSEITQTITATNLLEKAVTLESVSSTIKGVQAEIMGEVADSARRWTIRLSSDSGLSTGKINGRIQLKFSSGTVNVPVIGTVKPVIQVVPGQIRFPSRSNKEVERLVMLRREDGEGFDVESAELVNAQGRVEMQEVAAGKWKLMVHVFPDSLTPSARLKIRTSCKLQPEIGIPLSAE